MSYWCMYSQQYATKKTHLAGILAQQAPFKIAIRLTWSFALASWHVTAVMQFVVILEAGVRVTVRELRLVTVRGQEVSLSGLHGLMTSKFYRGTVALLTHPTWSSQGLEIRLWLWPTDQRGLTWGWGKKGRMKGGSREERRVERTEG